MERTRNKTIKILLSLALFILGIGSMALSPVGAQTGVQVGVDIGEGKDPLLFELPTFFSFDEVKYFSVFSYVAILLNIVFILLIVVWVFLAVKAAFEWIKSEGSEEMIASSQKRFKGIFSSISFLFIFFIVVILGANFVGFGSIFDWPKQFSRCLDGSYYYTLQLELSDLSDADIDRACFTTSGSNEICVRTNDLCITTCSTGSDFTFCLNECSQAYSECRASRN